MVVHEDFKPNSIDSGFDADGSLVVNPFRYRLFLHLLLLLFSYFSTSLITMNGQLDQLFQCIIASSKP